MGFELDGIDDDAPAQEESKFRKSDNNIALTKKLSQEQRQLREEMQNEETKKRTTPQFIANQAQKLSLIHI